MRKILKRALRFYHDFTYMIKDDIASETEMPIYRRIRWYLKGFISDRYVLYEFHKNNPEDYLPDFYRYRTSHINGKYSIILNDKKLFAELLKDKIPNGEVYGHIMDRQIHISDQVSDIAGLLHVVKQHEKVIIKRQNDGGGKGIYLLSYDGVFKVNMKPVDIAEFLETLDHGHDYLIMEFFRQSAYASEIFPFSANSIRVQTMKDPDNGEHFIALAVHKFGRMTSIPTDNRSNGGVFVGVDIETGVMGRPCLYSKEEGLRYFDRHPDTDAQISGVEVPNWSQVKEDIIKMAEKLDYLAYVGWDVVITDEGVKVIEGNNHTGIRMQMFQPLYANPRAKRFYEYHFERLN